VFSTCGEVWVCLTVECFNINAEWKTRVKAQALVSFKKYIPPPLPYFKVNICPFPLPHFVSIFFAYLWSFRWPKYIVTLPRYFSFRLPHLNIPTGPPSDELDKNIQRTSYGLFFSHWNGYSHFRSGLNWFRKFKKRCFKNQMSVIWSWTFSIICIGTIICILKAYFTFERRWSWWHCYTWPV
jgi:hypothetical protein